MIALQFSGGKDSLACLHLYRDNPDVTVLYVDSGSAFPHVRPFVERTTAHLGMKLHVASPAIPCEQWQDEYGLPVDILPVDASPTMRGAAKNRYGGPLVPYPLCCAANIWGPLVLGVQEIGADTVVRGSKACDVKVGVPDGHVENGITYLSPLWTWSDDDVLAYLEKVGAELPPQYAEGCDSLDCWCCTAYMNAHGAARYAYLKAHYPTLYERASGRLASVRGSLKAALADIMLEV